MAELRILSGVLAPGVASGTVTLDFNSWTDGSLGDANLVETSIAGAAGRFAAPPGKVLSVREFTETAGVNSTIQITDFTPTQDSMGVTWNAINANLVEISVVIIGEA